MTADNWGNTRVGPLRTPAVLVAFCVSVSVGCAAGEPRPAGPPPEYEPPQVLPWDSGEAEDPSADPFAAAAVGGWLEEPDGAIGSEPFPDGGGAEAGSVIADSASFTPTPDDQDASAPPAQESGSPESGSPVDQPVSR